MELRLNLRGTLRDTRGHLADDCGHFNNESWSPWTILGHLVATFKPGTFLQSIRENQRKSLNSRKRRECSGNERYVLIEHQHEA